MTPIKFVKDLTSLEFQDTFNPYAHRCQVHDHDDAPIRRRHMLLAMLKAAVDMDMDAIWIGRDLGYRGGRRSGLALTDEFHLHTHAARWGVRISRPTKGLAVKERTATVIWDVLSQIEGHVFLWNVFPLHPHEPADPFTNRQHNARERRAGLKLLSALVDLLKPRRLIAIGNDAATAARGLSQDISVQKVRHPSYGGQTKFLTAIRELYPPHCPSTGLQHSFRL